MMKKLALLIVIMVMTTAVFADVWQLKVKSNGKWKTQTVSKEEFIQLHDSSKILDATESFEPNAKIKNYFKTVSYEISVISLPDVERAKLIHYYQKGE